MAHEPSTPTSGVPVLDAAFLLAEGQAHGRTDPGRAAEAIYEAAQIAALAGSPTAEVWQMLTDSLNADPSYQPAAWALRHLAVQAGRWQDLLHVLDAESRRSRFPTLADRADLFVERGRILEDRLGRPEAASESYRAALDVAGDHGPARLALLLHAQSTDNTTATARLQSILDTFPPEERRRLAPHAAYLAFLIVEGPRDGDTRTGDSAGALFEAEKTNIEPRRLTLLARRLYLPTLTTDDVLGVADAVLSMPTPDPRLLASLFVRAAERAQRSGDDSRAVTILRRALDLDARHLTALCRLADLLVRAGDLANAGPCLEAAAAAAAVPQHRSSLFLLASAAASSATSRATTDPATTQRQIEQADALAEASDRLGAKTVLRRLLGEQPRHLDALRRLAELEFMDGAYAIAAELYLRLAPLETDVEATKKIYRRLGRVYAKRLLDLKLATSAYEKVIALDPNNVESLSALCDLYARQNEMKRAIVVGERAVGLEADPNRRLILKLRMADLHEKQGDKRSAARLFRRIASEAPRNLLAVGELARFLERSRDPGGRRVLLDTSLALMREDLKRDPGDLEALRMVMSLLRWRKRPAGSAAAAQVLGALTVDPREQRDVQTWAAAPAEGRRLTPLLNPELDEMVYPATLPRGLRQVMNLIGPALIRRSRADVRRIGVERAQRLRVGEGARRVLDSQAVDLGVRGYEVYVINEHPRILTVEPGDPPAILLGSDIVAAGPLALRFAGGYCLRLIATHFDLLLGRGTIEGAALLAGLTLHFLREHRFEGVPEAAVSDMYARVGRILSRSMRTDLSPFVAEIAAPMAVAGLEQALVEMAARVGLLCCGDLAVSLQVLLASRDRTLSPDAFRLEPFSARLFDFSLSPEYDVLVRALDSVA